MLLYSTRLFGREAGMPGRRPKPLPILLRRAAIEQRVRRMGAEITRDFRGQRLHLIGVLKGAAIFLSDLIRQIRLDVSLDFIGVASYDAQQSSGQVRLTKDLDTSIEGMNVILVEDILDTGLTIDYLQRILAQRKPRTLRTAVLLEKPASRRVRNVKVEYTGFRIPDHFVVGYGLDYAERYRNLRDIRVLPLRP
jgi:hypoxanthine phosphoribosyltransferase